MREKPLTFKSEKDIEKMFLRTGRKVIPNFGSYRPKKWEIVRELFCDTSGFGRPDEPALTADQFKRTLKALFLEHPEYGYAITSCGQFQCYVSVFAPKDG